MGDLAIFNRYVRARTRSDLQYRTSFASFVLAQAVTTFLDCVSILVLFNRVSALGGWDRGQVLVLYATTVLAFGFADLLVGSVDRTADYVRQGSFDRVLIRPAGVLAQMLGDEFALRRMGRVTQGIVVLAVILLTGEATLSWPRSLLLVPTIVCGTVTFSAVFVLVSTISFWWPGSTEVGNAFTYGGFTASQYPTHIFQPWLRRLFVFVIPVGVVSYGPCTYVLEAPNPLGMPVWMQVLSPLVFVPMVLVAAFAWRLGLRRYESTGS